MLFGDPYGDDSYGESDNVDSGDSDDSAPSLSSSEDLDYAPVPTVLKARRHRPRRRVVYFETTTRTSRSYARPRSDEEEEEEEDEQEGEGRAVNVPRREERRDKENEYARIMMNAKRFTEGDDTRNAIALYRKALDLAARLPHVDTSVATQKLAQLQKRKERPVHVPSEKKAKRNKSRQQQPKPPSPTLGFEDMGPVDDYRAPSPPPKADEAPVASWSIPTPPVFWARNAFEEFESEQGPVVRGRLAKQGKELAPEEFRRGMQHAFDKLSAADRQRYEERARRNK